MGMVYANRPWRLVAGLSKVMTAAFAAGAVSLAYPTIWQLSATMGPWRLTAATVLASAALIAWLILDHELWERPHSAGERERAVLYNTATVVTLIIGVAIFHTGLFILLLVILAAAYAAGSAAGASAIRELFRSVGRGAVRALLPQQRARHVGGTGQQSDRLQPGWLRLRPHPIPRSRSAFRHLDGYPHGPVPGHDDSGVPDREVVRRQHLGGSRYRAHRRVDVAQSGDGVRYLLLRQFFQTVPVELEEAARVDGTSRLGVLFKIVLPLSMPAMSTLAALTVLTSWNDFLWPLIVITSQDQMTIPLGLSYFQGHTG
jgi:hypothetical protein